MTIGISGLAVGKGRSKATSTAKDGTGQGPPSVKRSVKAIGKDEGMNAKCKQCRQDRAERKGKGKVTSRKLRTWPNYAKMSPEHKTKNKASRKHRKTKKKTKRIGAEDRTISTRAVPLGLVA